jgi:hypothetical protein
MLTHLILFKSIQNVAFRVCFVSTSFIVLPLHFSQIVTIAFLTYCYYFLTMRIRKYLNLNIHKPYYFQHVILWTFIIFPCHENEIILVEFCLHYNSFLQISAFQLQFGNRCYHPFFWFGSLSFKLWTFMLHSWCIPLCWCSVFVCIDPFVEFI